MSTTFTPGPWILEKLRAPNGGAYYRIFEPGADVTVCLAQVIFSGNEAYHENARLIAAAPELLAELKTAQNALRRALPYLPADTEAVHAGECLDAIAAAIAKATSA